MGFVKKHSYLYITLLKSPTMLGFKAFNFRSFQVNKKDTSTNTYIQYITCKKTSFIKSKIKCLEYELIPKFSNIFT